MCPEQDSNLHASQHAHLKRARLPFRHLGNNHYFIEHAPCAFFVRAENEARTRDPNLGKVVLYQLSYFRIIYVIFQFLELTLPRLLPYFSWGKVVLYQLSYFRKLF